MVPWRVFIVVRGATQIVSDGIDGKRAMMSCGHAEGTNEIEPSQPIVPQQSGDACRQDVTEHCLNVEVPAMLPLYQRVLSQVGYFGWPCFKFGVKDYPADVRPKETPLGVIWIEVGIGISVVRTVPASPPVTRALNCTCPGQDKEDLQREGGVVRSMGPQTMIACSNTEHSVNVVTYGTDGRLRQDWYPQQTIQGDGRGKYQHTEVEPPDPGDGGKPFCELLEQLTAKHGKVLYPIGGIIPDPFPQLEDGVELRDSLLKQSLSQPFKFQT